MSSPSFYARLQQELQEIKDAGLYKNERIIESEQGAEITVNGKTVLNFCANNYLGLSSHPRVIEAAHKAIDHRGYGMSSVRFICGTQDIHKELEEKLAKFLGTEDTILYVSMPMGVFSNHYSAKTMPLFPMSSITHPS
jgi:glycine C-acetyltransferase